MKWLTTFFYDQKRLYAKLSLIRRWTDSLSGWEGKTITYSVGSVKVVLIIIEVQLRFNSLAKLLLLSLKTWVKKQNDPDYSPTHAIFCLLYFMHSSQYTIHCSNLKQLLGMLKNILKLPITYFLG